jgi:hypothetical protein
MKFYRIWRQNFPNLRKFNWRLGKQKDSVSPVVSLRTAAAPQPVSFDWGKGFLAL